MTRLPALHGQDSLPNGKTNCLGAVVCRRGAVLANLPISASSQWM